MAQQDHAWEVARAAGRGNVPALAFVVYRRAAPYVDGRQQDHTPMGGSFPIDLLLFGMIAAFLVLRLRGILGRRTGFERSEGGPVQVPGMARPAAPTIDAKAEPAAPARPLPDPAGPTGIALGQMHGVDRNFD